MYLRYYIPVMFTSLLFWVQGAVFSQGSWERVELPTGRHMRSVCFTDSLYGWIAGDTGTMLHTVDGGNSWMFQDMATDNKIVDVFFLDRETGWAVSWNYDPFFGTLIHQTTDGGDHWTAQPYQDGNIFINHIQFSDTLNGWMGGSPHALVRTNDGGINWTQAGIDTSTLAFFPVLKIKFYDEKYGYASGGMFDIAGVTWSTSDGGNNWTAIKTEDAPADEVHGLHIFDSVTVMGSGGDPDLGYGVGMIRTHDGGDNWEYEELSMPGAAYDLDFVNDTEAWAPLGVNQKLIYSLDAGTSWTRIDSPGNTSIFDIIFPDSLHGYGVGYNGSFIRYIPLPVGVSEKHINHIDLNIFPNPAGSKARVTITEDADGGIRGRMLLKMTDINGKTWLLYELENLNGDDHIDLDLTGMPAGTYLLECTFPRLHHNIVKKLILR